MHPLPTLVFLLGPLLLQSEARRSPDGVPPPRAEPAAEDSARFAPRVGAILRKARADEPPADEELAAELVDLGRLALPALLSTLEAGRIEPEGVLPAQRLSRPQERLVLRALAAIPWPRVENALDARRSASEGSQDEVPARIAAVKVRGSMGEASDLDDVIADAMTKREADLDERMETAFEEAVASLLRRHPEASRRLLSAWRDMPDPLLERVLFGVGEARDPRGLELLCEVLLWKQGLADVAVSQVLLVGRGPGEEVNRIAAELLHGLLGSDRTQRSAAAARALGVLEEPACVPALIGLLERGSMPARESALWALRRMSGLGFAAQPGPWTRWHGEERLWYERERPRLLRDLLGSEPAAACEALRAVSGHRLFRHELAREVAAALDGRHPVVRRTACQALAALGSGDASLALVRALQHEDPGTSTAAWLALKAITGRDLPAEIEAWRGALRLDP